METINQRSSESNNLKDEKLIKLSALIVDDNPTIRTLQKSHLNKRGFSTTVVKNGKEAVDLYGAGNSFDIVIMDLEMPIMDGIKATKQLREMGVQSLIIGATASESNTDIENFKKAGLDKYYAKPLSDVMFDEILQTLKKN